MAPVTRPKERPTRAAPTRSYAAWVIPLGIGFVTILAFAPGFGNEFVSWDDQKNFLENPHYRGLGWAQLKWMWTTFHLGHYVPLSWMTLGLDYELWGMNPTGYHATSILLHAANAVVFYHLARRLLALADAPSARIDTAAAIAALLFAVHPLRVESVVWITERRDVLSLLFYQASIVAYLKSVEHNPQRRWYLLSLVAFLCALLSKATSMTLPAVLALLNIYPLRRVTLPRPSTAELRRVMLELLPFGLLTLGTIFLSIIALRPPGQLPLGDKLVVSAFSLAFYVYKTLIPAALSPLYEMPQRIDALEARFVAAYVGCVALATVAWATRRRWPGGTTLLVASIIIVAPMLGVVQNGPQIAADRYTYHAAPPLALLAAGALTFTTLSPALARGIAAVSVVVLSALTWKQSDVWQNSERLWTHALALDPNSAIAHSSMATLRFKENRVEEAMRHARRSVELAPRYSQGHNDVGVGLARTGRLADAANEYQLAMELEPTYDEAVNNLGVVVAQQGNLDSAITLYRRALELNPDYADAHVNWGNALVRAKRPAEAIPHYQAALVIRADHADARLNWGVALAQQGQFDAAAAQFRAALAIDPNHAEAKEYLDRAMRLMQKR
jgi:protein O-mannosyl-transferase